MSILRVENISKRFDKTVAVDNISFQIEKGKVYGILGPNGAGKTTTIRMIMNIIIPDSGEIEVLGEKNLKRINSKIGYLPEERGIYRKMKVNDVLKFLAELKEMKGKSAQSEIDKWLEKLDLTKWKKSKVEELSKGMQQKLQFIATVMPQPDILILDEPFLGLDPINTQLIKDIIMEEKERGTTIIFSTHQMESAEKLCDEIMLINKGKKILDGPVPEVKKQFGRKCVQISYTGDNSFLKSFEGIKSYNDFGNYVEVDLKAETNPQDLLKEIVDKISISRFEIMEPSLHDIFIKSVKGEDKS